MYFTSTLYIRIVAIISLLLGLSDAARLLGVGQGPASPIATLGLAGFAYLAAFALARLFAAVGLWMMASWGALLLVLATLAEIVLYATGSHNLHMSVFALVIRIVLLAAVLVIFAMDLRVRRAAVHE